MVSLLKKVPHEAVNMQILLVLSCSSGKHHCTRYTAGFAIHSEDCSTPCDKAHSTEGEQADLGPGDRCSLG